MNETISSILERRSNRGFEAKPLSDEQLDTLKQCALAAPTAMNAQSWHFSFVTNADIIKAVEDATLDELYATADEATKQRITSRGKTIFYGAPLVVFISSDNDNYWSHIDAGIASENLAVAAQSMGLGSVIIGLCKKAFDGEKRTELEKLLCFPENHSFSIAVALGVPTATKDAHPVMDGKLCVID